ncbi:MAG: response regulator [Nitrospira sp.]|nr:response regulator [Nitrospira sp.]MBS0194363.1 response regulator [Pseudomonadota bacterium]
MNASAPRALPVLVVDDQATARFLYRTLLEAAGFHVVEACNGREGLMAIQCQAFACIVLDVQMPEMDGWAVLRALGYPSPSCGVPPVFLHSGEADSETMQVNARALHIPIRRKQDVASFVASVQALAPR